MKKKATITSFPMTLFMTALLLTLICFLGFSWYIWKSSSEFETTEKRGFRLYELSSTITQTAEISSMSARMAVTTGDPSWEKYYRSLQPLMTGAIEEAEILAPDLYLSGEGNEIKKIRVKLAGMEKKAFDLVSRGSANRAMKLPHEKHFRNAEELLFSREYDDLKKNYTEKVAQINSITHTRAKAAINAQRMLGFWGIISLIVAMPLFLFAWSGVLRKIKYYIIRRNEAEKILQESEQKFRNLVTEINDGFFICDKKGVITFANSAYARINGFKRPEELIGRPLLEFVDPDTRKTLARDFLHGIETGTFTKKLEASIIRKDGSKAFIQIDPAIHIEGRSIAGFRGIMLDISERKLAEKELRESREDLSLLYNISSVIGQTMDMKELSSRVLTSIRDIDIFNFELKGGIFIIDDDKMNLVSHTGHSEFFLMLHKDLKIGKCLCGLAAKTGEPIMSKDSSNDSRHTIRYTGMIAHGAIVIPLKARGKVVGVLYLYMPVGFDIDERSLSLLISIGNQVGVALDNSRLYEETKRSSLYDPLTGVANRRMMHLIFKRNFEEAKRYGRPFSVIMLDVDFFKKYNDTKGHTAGDLVLVDVSKVLTNSTRGVDLVSRYGGEEFLILLPETDLQGAQILAERIRESIEEETDVTASLGIACCTGETQSEEDLLNKADAALYQAKEAGRNRVEIGV